MIAEEILSNLGNIEMRYSYIYMLILLAVSVCLIALNLRAFAGLAKGRFVTVSLVLIIIIAATAVFGLSPKGDLATSRSEDYRLAAKYYSLEGRYQLCKEGNRTVCFVPRTMDKAMGYPFLLSIFFSLFGIGISNSMLFNLIFAAFSPALLFLALYISTRNGYLSWFASLFLIFSGDFLRYSTQSEVINMCVFWFCLSVCLMAAYYRTRRRGLLAMTMFALLWLGYMRVELVLMSFMFIALNLRGFKAYWDKRTGMDALFFSIYALLFFLLLLHIPIDIYYSSSRVTGNYAGFGYLASRIIPFIGNYWMTITGVVAIFILSFRRAAAKSDRIYLFCLACLVLYPLMILAYNGSESQGKYLAYLEPAIIMLIFLGLNLVLGMERINSLAKAALVGGALLGLLLFEGGYYLTGANPDNSYFSAGNVDALAASIQGGTVFAVETPIISRLQMYSNFTCSYVMNDSLLDREGEGMNGEEVYILLADEDIGSKQYDMLLGRVNMDLIGKSGSISLYRIW
jgi:hypothetical protein